MNRKIRVDEKTGEYFEAGKLPPKAYARIMEETKAIKVGVRQKFLLQMLYFLLTEKIFYSKGFKTCLNSNFDVGLPKNQNNILKSDTLFSCMYEIVQLSEPHVQFTI
jgi:hypothetical protein